MDSLFYFSISYFFFYLFFTRFSSFDPSLGHNFDLETFVFASDKKRQLEKRRKQLKKKKLATNRSMLIVSQSISNRSDLFI